jgi:hypothetical protein
VIREPKEEEEEGGSYANRMVITRGISPPSFPQIIERERESDQPVLYSTQRASYTIRLLLLLLLSIWLVATYTVEIFLYPFFFPPLI